MIFPRHTYKLGKHTCKLGKHTYQLGKHTYMLSAHTLVRMVKSHERVQVVQSCLYKQHKEFIASGQACRHIKAMSSIIRDVNAVNIFETVAIIHLLTLLGSATHCTQGDGPGHQLQLCVASVSKDALRRFWERAGLSCAVG